MLGAESASMLAILRWQRHIWSILSIRPDGDRRDSALTDGLRDRYPLGRALARGGRATIYLARDLKHDRKVA